MKLLVVGGSRFVGRHLVEAAMAAGHTVTLFNRGQSGAAPAGVEQGLGDRRKDLSALAQDQWDTVVDTCGYLPGEVQTMAACLRGRVGRYLLISSISAYADATTTNPETAPLGQFDKPEDAQTHVVDGASYGPRKALCEAQVQAAFGDDGLILRPGLIVGPHDPTQRFTYWPARIARAAPDEPVLAQGPADAAVQFIDARDLAAFMLTLLARPAGAEHRHFLAVDNHRAVAAGLVTRPLADTVADTLAWYRRLPTALQTFDKAGLTPEREAMALEQILLAQLAQPPRAADDLSPRPGGTPDDLATVED